jgi:hypothetical protein
LTDAEARLRRFQDTIGSFGDIDATTISSFDLRMITDSQQNDADISVKPWNGK